MERRQDQCYAIHLNMQLLFQLLAEQSCQQAVERCLDGFVDDGQSAVLLISQHLAEERPMLRVLRHDAWQERLCGSIILEEHIECQDRFLKIRRGIHSHKIQLMLTKIRSYLF